MDNIKSVLTRRVSELEKRVAALEQALGGKAPPKVCRFCGERAVRLHCVQSDEKGLVEEKWKCVACSQIDVRVFRPPFAASVPQETPGSAGVAVAV